ncbi:MAG: GAF domain-containing protein [Bacteroidales bacterium]|nr:GAF domain-containing protein [Bacteroidales bacterium]
MKYSFHFTLKLKLLLGFGLLGILLLLVYRTMNNTQSVNSVHAAENSELIFPSMIYTERLKDLIETSQYLTTKWTLKGEPRDGKLLGEIESCHGELYDSLKAQIVGFVDKDLWNDKNKELYFKLTSVVDTLFTLQADIVDNLNTPEKFADKSNYSFRRYSVTDGEAMGCYKRAYLTATQLANSFRKDSREKLDIMETGFNESDNLLNIGMLIIFVCLIVIYLVLNYNLRKLNYLKEKIKEMSEGILPEVEVKGNDEIAEMTQILRTLISNLDETSHFAIKIGEGNFSTEFKPRSKHDVLANSLLVMRDNLIKAENEAEERKVENTQRNWASQGLAEFNEVLRNAGDDMQVLSNRVIERLVRYLDANMGGIYIVDDSDPADIHLELTAFYAYDRLKYAKQRIEVGENLVGQCFRENETVYMTDIPKDYVHICSGLGEADPTCLVIVPLKVNAETFGIVELASFQVIEKYQVEFIEKIGETIASTIASVKINMNTAKLLEESHQKSERLAQQEAEVHKNIETLKSKIENLEELNKRESVKYQKLHDDFENQAETNASVIQKLNDKNEKIKDELMTHQYILNNSAGYYELDAQGFFMSMNARLLNSIVMQYTELDSHDVRSYMLEEESIKNFDEGLKKLADGLIYSAVNKYSFNGKQVYLSEIYTPIRDEYNVLTKICVIAKNITHQIENVNDLNRQIAELKAENEILNNKVMALSAN